MLNQKQKILKEEEEKQEKSLSEDMKMMVSKDASSEADGSKQFTCLRKLYRKTDPELARGNQRSEDANLD